MIRIPKNVILRNKVSKNIQKGGESNPPITKMPKGVYSEINRLTKRVNSNLRKRLNSMLAYNSISVEEAADFIELFIERLRIDGISMEEVDGKRRELNEKYGNYEKHFNADEVIETEIDDCGFIPFESDFHRSKPFDEAVRLPRDDRE